MRKFTSRVKQLSLSFDAGGEAFTSIAVVKHDNAAVQKRMLEDTLLTALTSRDATITFVAVHGDVVDARHESFVKELEIHHGRKDTDKIHYRNRRPKK